MNRAENVRVAVAAVDRTSARTRSRIVGTVIITLAALLASATPALGAPPTVEADVVPGQIYTTGEPTFTGRATDDGGVARVQVAIKRRDTGLWLQPGGGWAERHRKFDTTLSSPGATATDWSFTVPHFLGYGDYRLSVRATDSEGETASLRPWRPFEIDYLSPEIKADFPYGTTFAGPAITVSGTASDRNGVTAVSVAFEGPSGWLQPDGSFGPARADLPASVADPGSSETAWLRAVSLPAGEYQMYVSAVDGVSNARRNWSIPLTSDTSGVPIPVVQFDRENRDTGSDRNRAIFTASPLTLHGFATDDSAVTRVLVAIRQRRTALWLQQDGSFAERHRKFSAVLSDPGAAVTDWSFTANLPDGEYLLSVRAIDDAGNQTSVRPWQWFEVDTVGPEISVAVPFGATLLGPEVRLRGRLVDEHFVSWAKVAIKDRATGLWLQPDGTFSERHRKMWARVPNASDEMDLPWFFETTLPAGDYSLSVRAGDIRGNVSSLRPWRHFTVDPTIDTIPVPTAFPAGTTFTSSPVVLEGTARDDLAVGRVHVAIRDRTTGMWWDGRGFREGMVKRTAVLTDPAAPVTDWSYEAALPDGEYALSVRAYDVQGYSSSITPWRRFTVDTG